MRTDYDFPHKYRVGPVIFRPEFNERVEAITATQAWSLFFTAGQEDKALGFSPEVGRFFSNVLIATGAAGILWSLIFSAIA